MSNLYRCALGEGFARLHPRVQERLDRGCAGGFWGEGVMTEIWRAGAWVLPFLWLGSRQNVLLPAGGRNVAFRIENHAWRDGHGRDVVCWVRRFALPRPRRIDGYMTWNAGRGCVVDYFGTGQQLAVDLQLWTADDGGFALRSASQRLLVGRRAVALPAPLCPIAAAHERFDETTGRFHVEVTLTHPLLGRLFGYRGHFAAVPVGPPADDLRPRREAAVG